jgi:hypothetical protein
MLGTDAVGEVLSALGLEELARRKPNFGEVVC